MHMPVEGTSPSLHVQIQIVFVIFINPMLDITILCVGRMKEKFYIDAAAEYVKRLGAYCKIAVTELTEVKKSESPSDREREAALSREAEDILSRVPKGAAVIAMCIEGKELSSREFAAKLDSLASGGVSKLCFVIGGSDGLHESVKNAAQLKMSMSRMTFPHHLARVMLLEQIYRALNISSGGKYHK